MKKLILILAIATATFSITTFAESARSNDVLHSLPGNHPTTLPETPNLPEATHPTTPQKVKHHKKPKKHNLKHHKKPKYER